MFLINTHPEIAAQWHPTKNGGLPIEIVTSKNGRRIWWKCPTCSNDWQAEVKSRTYKGSGCPYCSGSKVCENNCLATTFPEIAKQWHPTKNGTLTPKDVTHGSSQIKVWWRCDSNQYHEWQSTVNKRTSNRGCPFCSGQKCCESNCLSTLRPELANEWHPANNGTSTPEEFVLGAARKVWWKCKKCSNDWKAAIRDRAYKDSGCPKCASSKGEKKIALILSKMNIEFKKEAKFESCRNIRPLRFDFQIQNVLIEFNGNQHYEPVRRGKNMTCTEMDANLVKIQYNDKIKVEWAEKTNTPLLIIPYWENHLEEKVTEFLRKEQVI